MKRKRLYIEDIVPVEYLRTTLQEFLPWYAEYIRKHAYIYTQYGYRMFTSDPAILEDCLCRIGGLLHNVMTEANDDRFLFLDKHPNVVDISYLIYRSEEVKEVMIRTLYEIKFPNRKVKK